jgi:Zn-dependent M28 family amino/carboxypeptidase
MRLIHSHEIEPGTPAAEVRLLLDTIVEAQLRAWVERLSVPRHFLRESAQNEAAAKWLADGFSSFGYEVQNQGAHRNVVALPRADVRETLLVGAHYDSIPECPGADDNASAVAAMLGCAAACAKREPPLPIIFVAFNREEEHLLGSRDFVERFLPGVRLKVRCAHILEMVGYAKHDSGTQKLPTGLPIQIPERGDFLGLLANGASARYLESAVQSSRTYLPQLPVVGLKVDLGVERVFPVLARSDHVPFWDNGIPAVMWTDTSEFRNPHYHQITDTPNTLDYAFLRAVTQALTATVLQHGAD